MKIQTPTGIQEWTGAYPSRENQNSEVVILSGSNHSGIDEFGCQYLATEFDEISGEDFDHYTLPEGCSIVW